MPAERSRSAAGREPGRRRKPDVRPSFRLAGVKEVRPLEYAVRFGFGAAISVSAGVLGKAVGARFAGMFLAFPAILPASLTLIQDKEGTRRADRDAIGAVLGGLALVVFAAVGEGCFRKIEPFVALLLALLAWIVAAFALYAVLALLRPELCDRNRD